MNDVGTSAQDIVDAGGVQLEILSRVLRREAHLLAEEPGILVSHLHNRVFLELGERGPAAPLLAAARKCLSTRPWLRLVNRPPTRADWDRVLNHGSPVLDLGWSADGRRLASVGSDRVVRVWDPDAGTADAEIEPSSGFAWRPYGSELVSWNRGVLRGHDGGGGATWACRLDDGAGEIAGAAWSPDGATIVAGTSRGALLLVDPSTETHTTLWAATEDSASPVDRIVFSRTGANLVAGRSSLRLWRLEGNEWMAAGEGVGRHATWSPEGTRLGVISPHYHLHFLDETGSDLTGGDSSRGNRSCIDWSPAGAVATGRFVEGHGYTAWIDVLDPESGEEDKVPASAAAQVRDVAWSPTGRALAFAGAHPPEVGIWRRGRTRRLEGHTDAVVKVAWSPDERVLASASDDGTVRTWNIGPAEERESPPQGHSARVTVVAWSPDGSRLASGARDNTVCVWDASTGGRVARLTGLQSSETFGYGEWIDALAWSPDGRLLAAGGTSQGDHRTLHVWEPIAEDDVFSLAHSSTDLAVRTDGVAVEALAWSSDGRTLTSHDDDGMVRTWKISLVTRKGVEARLVNAVRRDAVHWPGTGAEAAEGIDVQAVADGARITVSARGGRAPPAIAHCLSPVVALQLGVGADVLRAADNGVASGNRPLAYVFELRNVVPERSGAGVEPPQSGAARPRGLGDRPGDRRWRAFLSLLPRRRW